MSDKEKTIEVLQAIVTGLSANSFGHRIQSKIFAGLGFQSLGDKYATHAAEEMGFVEQFMDRILDLGGTPLVQPAPEMPVFTDPVEYIKADLAISQKEVPVLQNLTMGLQEDFKTYDILRGYALDEEEDMYWSETQLELIEKIGLQNWLVKQL